MATRKTPAKKSTQRRKPSLTPRQQLFVRQYLVDLNATQAAIRAGYAPKNADVQGPRLLGKVGIANAVEAGLRKAAENASVTVQDVLAGLLREAQNTGPGTTQFARVQAWKTLGQYLAMFTDKVEHTGAGGGPIMTVFEQPPEPDLEAWRQRHGIHVNGD